jgi:hypothetical protein
MVPFRRTRVMLSWLVAALVFVPFGANLPSLEQHLHVWQRLRAAHRISPDDDWDRSLAALASALPPRGLVGFQFAGPPDDGRMFFRLQYALAPRQIVRSLEPPFVIEAGPAANDTSLTHRPGYVTVVQTADEVRVLRRLKP